MNEQLSPARLVSGAELIAVVRSAQLHRLNMAPRVRILSDVMIIEQDISIAGVTRVESIEARSSDQFVLFPHLVHVQRTDRTWALSFGAPSTMSTRERERA